LQFDRNDESIDLFGHSFGFPRRRGEGREERRRDTD